LCNKRVEVTELKAYQNQQMKLGTRRSRGEGKEVA